MSLYFPSFVAKASTRKTPIVGIIRCAARHFLTRLPTTSLASKAHPRPASLPAALTRSYLMNCIYVDRERAEGTGTSGAAAVVQKRLLRAAAAHAGLEEDDHERPIMLFPGARCPCDPPPRLLRTAVC